MAESINHYNGLRIRLTGSGLFRMTLESLNGIKTYPMIPFTMSATTPIEPTRLANFISQRALLRGEIKDFGDNFVISRIVIMIKPQVFNEYPA